LRFLRGLSAAALTCLLAAVMAVAPAQAGQTKAMRNVLILFPQEGLHAPAPQAIYRNICAVLDRSPKLEITTFVENLDLYPFPDDEAQEALASFLEKKYVSTQVDLIIPAASPGLNLALRLRGKLFPGTPIVYCAEVMRGERPLTHRSDVTGTAAPLDIAGTVELAQMVRPGLTHVAVVAGTGGTDQYLLALFREAFKAVKPQLDLIDLAGLPLDDLLDQVARLPASACILYLFVGRDGHGRIFPSWTVQEMVSLAANVPLFSLIDATLGYGSVGGRLMQTEATALKTGEIALRILSGESAAAIEPVAISETPAMFDWRQLQRWGIEESALPEGSIVRFKAFSQWERYRWWVIGIFAFVCLQSLLLFMLIHNLIQRKRAEEEAARTRHNLAHATRISTVEQLGQSLAHEINQPLAAIRVNAEVASKLAGGETPDIAEVQAALGDIVADSRRAQAIIASIRSLVKNTPPELARVELNQVAADALKLVQAHAEAKGVAIRLDLQAGLPPVHGDAVQLQQVALNLLLNALDSVCDRPLPPRSVTVGTAREKGARVKLCVRDNGPGIDPEAARRLFEPFFSTKLQGLGLGLSICRSIAEAHGGSLGLDAGVEEGAAFCLYLPAGLPKNSKRLTGGPNGDGRDRA
jgi:signal transduction histidine kinase